jgi:hypothetical protein
LNEDERSAMRFSPVWGQWYSAGSNAEAANWRGAGWSGPEESATWSNDERAVVYVPCVTGHASARLELEVVPFVAPGRDAVRVRIVRHRDVLWSGALSAPAVIQVALARAQCRRPATRIVIEIDSPASPAALGLSDDERRLGVALRRYRITQPEVDSMELVAAEDDDGDPFTMME